MIEDREGRGRTAVRSPDGASGTKFLYTSDEAAEALGLGRTTVYRLMRTGRLRSVKVGSNRRITASALAEFVHALEDDAA